MPFVRLISPVLSILLRTTLWGSLCLFVLVITALLQLGIRNLEGTLAKSRPLVPITANVSIDTVQDFCSGEDIEVLFYDTSRYINIRPIPVSTQNTDLLIEYVRPEQLPEGVGKKEEVLKSIEAATEVARVLYPEYHINKIRAFNPEDDFFLSYWEYLWDPTSLPYIDGRRASNPLGSNSPETLADTLVNASWKHSCSWELMWHPADRWLLLSGYLLAEASGSNTLYEWVQRRYDNIIGSKAINLLMGFPSSTESFHLLNGAHYLVFTRADGEQLTIWKPVTPALTFIRNVQTLFLLGWSVLIFLIGIAFFWLMAKPLRVIARAAQEAIFIIRTNDGVPEQLNKLAGDLLAKNNTVKVHQKLLHNMAALLEEREEWTGVAMHQLKNQLEVIAVSLHKLPTPEDDMSESKISALRDINNASGRIRNVLDNIATYQWALFGTPETSSNMDINSMLQTITDDIDDVGGEVTWTGQCQANVAARKLALTSALENLLWNAYHHGGAITIGTRLIDVDRRVEILIDDDGPGIDDDIDELFKPYRQGNSSRDNGNNVFRGAGLGLTIAKGVIEDHGGKISIINRENTDGTRAGLSVRVVLPLFLETRTASTENTNG